MTLILILTIWRDVIALHWNRAALSMVKEDRPKEGLKKGVPKGGVN